jgi:hypothetical protein
MARVIILAELASPGYSWDITSNRPWPYPWKPLTYLVWYLSISRHHVTSVVEGKALNNPIIINSLNKLRGKPRHIKVIHCVLKNFWKILFCKMDQLRLLDSQTYASKQCRGSECGACCHLSSDTKTTLFYVHQKVSQVITFYHGLFCCRNYLVG